MNHLFRIILLLGIVATPTPARSLDELQKGFMDNYDALNAGRDQRLEKLTAGYLRVLDQLMSQAKGTGDLDALLPVRDEITAIKDGVWPLTELPAGSSEELGANREKYVGTREKIEENHAAELVKLAAKMETLLKQEEVELTQAGKIDQAVSVKRMREALLEDAGLQRARQISGPLDDGDASARLGRIPPEIEEQAFTVGKTTYYLFPESMNHAEAVAACRKIGGKLLSIDSEAEYGDFHAYSVENRKSLWIDLQDEEKDQDWRHADGAEARFLKWQSGEPNGGDRQKHVMIGHQGSWDMRDVNPDDKFHVICEW